MNVKQHIIFGLSAGALAQWLNYIQLAPWNLLSSYQTSLEYLYFYTGIMMGSILPDIDSPTSFLGRRAPIISKSVSRVFGHRGFTHSLLSVFLLDLLLGLGQDLFSSLFSIGIIIGYLSHLVADGFTPRGVPLLYPLKIRFFRLTIFK